jgi:predicted transposase YbfD/YdcC
MNRIGDLAGYPTSAGEWEHLRQVWLVRQETMDKDESIAVEDRYFITSLTWNYLKPEQALLVVRNHWGIENDTFNSLDLQWQEDNRRWCTKGNAIWVLGLLRMMAYNLVQHLRKRHLRLKDEKGNWRTPPSWRITFTAVNNALVKNFAGSNGDVTSDKTV